MSEVSIVEEVVLEDQPFTKEQIISKTRKREVVERRQIWQTMLLEFTGLSLSDIGSMTGGKDHATVLHSKKTINNLCESDKRVYNTVEFIRNQIQLRIDLIKKAKNDFNNLFYHTYHTTTLTHEKEIEDVVEYVKLANLEIARNLSNLIIQNKTVQRLVDEDKVTYKIDLFIAERHELKAYVNQVIQSMPLSRIMEIRAAK